MASIETQLIRLMSGETGYENRQQKWADVMNGANSRRLKEEDENRIDASIRENDIALANRQEHLDVAAKERDKPDDTISEPTP